MPRVERLGKPMIDTGRSDRQIQFSLIHAANGIDLKAAEAGIAAKHADGCGAAQAR
jgi:hypothetical protein